MKGIKLHFLFTILLSINSIRFLWIIDQSSLQINLIDQVLNKGFYKLNVVDLFSINSWQRTYAKIN